jgi:hypothetical protein
MSGSGWLVSVAGLGIADPPGEDFSDATSCETPIHESGGGAVEMARHRPP